MDDASPRVSAIPQANPTSLGSGTPPARYEVGVEHDKPTSTSIVVDNLLRIKADYPKFQVALEEWERIEKDLWKRVNARESRSADLKNQIYNIVAIFSVFEGVVLTAVSQLAATQQYGSTPFCGKIWAPLVLTGFGTAVSCLGLFYKFNELQGLEKLINDDNQALQIAADRGQKLRRLGPEKFLFKKYAADSAPKQKPKSFGIDRIFFISSLLFFTVLFVLSYFVILCDLGVIRGWSHSGIDG